jgi:hypothetical protein
VSEFPERITAIAKKVGDLFDGAPIAVELVDLANELEDRLEEYARLASALMAQVDEWKRETAETRKLALKLAPPVQLPPGPLASGGVEPRA